MMLLYPHNQFAYNKLNFSLQTNQKACVVQPTGTGKSYITAKFLEDNPDKSFLLLTSSNYIIEQFNTTFKNSFDNYTYIAYPSLLSNDFKTIKSKSYDYIVLDEFHRVGAEYWGSKVNELIKTKKTKIIGLTATHIRYLEEERNMIEELFDGNIVHHLTLMECFDRGILPRPKYISTIYNIDKEVNSIINKIDNSNNNDKERLKKRIIEYKANWEYSNGVSQILKKHISTERNFLLFCKDIEHLKQMIPIVKDWFKIFNQKINVFKVYSAFSDSSKELNDFKKITQRNLPEFNLLFSVQQLNEGLHVPKVEGVIFLRPTESHIIYYQQLGRALETKGKQPIVFDMVNNFKKSKVHSDFKKSKYIPVFTKHSLKKEYDEFIFSFDVQDEILDLKTYFGQVKNELIKDVWDERFNLLVKELNNNKDFKLLSKNSKAFLNRCRQFSHKTSYKWAERNKKLDAIIPLLGFDWKTRKNSYPKRNKSANKPKKKKLNYKTLWNNNFNRFTKDLKATNNFDEISSQNKDWFFKTKKLYFRNKNKPYWKERIRKLNTLNIYFDETWDKHKAKTISSQNWVNSFENFKKDYLKQNKSIQNLSDENIKWLRKCIYNFNYCKTKTSEKLWINRNKYFLTIGLDLKSQALPFRLNIKQKNSWEQKFVLFSEEYKTKKTYSNMDSSFKRWFNLSKHNYKQSKNKSLWEKKLILFKQLDEYLFYKLID